MTTRILNFVFDFFIYLISFCQDENPQAEARQQYYSDMSCPVCLQQAVLPVETNCGHLFCGKTVVHILALSKNKLLDNEIERKIKQNW